MDEKIRHDKALEAYQAAYAKYQKDRTQLLDWIAEQDREKNKAFHDFQDTDRALALYNQTHRAKVALPQEPKFSDYYKSSPQQKNGELLFIGASTLALAMQHFGSCKPYIYGGQTLENLLQPQGVLEMPCLRQTTGLCSQDL